MLPSLQSPRFGANPPTHNFNQPPKGASVASQTEIDNDASQKLSSEGGVFSLGKGQTTAAGKLQTHANNAAVSSSPVTLVRKGLTIEATANSTNVPATYVLHRSYPGVGVTVAKGLPFAFSDSGNQTRLDENGGLNCIAEKDASGIIKQIKNGPTKSATFAVDVDTLGTASSVKNGTLEVTFNSVGQVQTVKEGDLELAFNASGQIQNIKERDLILATNQYGQLVTAAKGNIKINTSPAASGAPITSIIAANGNSATVENGLVTGITTQNGQYALSATPQEYTVALKPGSLAPVILAAEKGKPLSGSATNGAIISRLDSINPLSKNEPLTANFSITA